MLFYIDNAWEEIKARHAESGDAPTASDLYDALVQGAVERVRPKMMTVVPTMAGLQPVLWVSGIDSDAVSRVAAPMVGGLVSSTVLTLDVIPAIYALVKEWSVQDQNSSSD